MVTVRNRVRPLLALAALCTIGACQDDGETTADTVRSDRCIVQLHGKGGSGTATELSDGIAILSPSGNGEGWGGREWRYAQPAAFGDAISIVREAVDAAGCERIAVHGFSNGAAFAAALACSGERFERRLVGVVVDDPVTDSASVECAPLDDIEVVLYWTGALDDAAPPGADCVDLDWTCSGGVVRGVEAMAADLGVAVTASPLTAHERYDDAPEPRAWLSDSTT